MAHQGNDILTRTGHHMAKIPKKEPHHNANIAEPTQVVRPQDTRAHRGERDPRIMTNPKSDTGLMPGETA